MGEGSKRQEKSSGVCKPKVALVGSMGSLQLELLLRAVLEWAEMARFLYFSIPWSLHVGYLGKVHDLGQQGSISIAETNSIPDEC